MSLNFRTSCYRSLEPCTINFANDYGNSWRNVIHLIKSKNDAVGNISKLVVSAINKVVLKSPRIAIKIKEKCGAVRHSHSNIPLKTNNSSSSKIQLQIDSAFSFQRHISEISDRLNNWRIFARTACAASSISRQSEMCWNGTHSVRSRERSDPSQSISVPIANPIPIQEDPDELAALTKDVRPRPVEPWLESSGDSKKIGWNMDDEDLAEESGSGVPPEREGINARQEQKTISESVVIFLKKIVYE
ncbi:hypothetical protein WR25_26722 [Diploscapter pachys]|uniref:Uncharacterized protein n=1 Tax=Diploscapter pachys TaxID=2018661 RepID=A0A2A2JL21_9BILA|nr:hypothetical protein WR25_26722 [Diploscapter pachys]